MVMGVFRHCCVLHIEVRQGKANLIFIAHFIHSKKRTICFTRELKEKKEEAIHNLSVTTSTQERTNTTYSIQYPVTQIQYSPLIGNIQRNVLMRLSKEVCVNTSQVLWKAITANRSITTKSSFTGFSKMPVLEDLRGLRCGF